LRRQLGWHVQAAVPEYFFSPNDHIVAIDDAARS